MRYEEPVYRPPSEAYSLILQVTIGCSHNKCTFCSMYKQKKYRVRELAEIKADIETAKIFYGGVEKIFLADGDALAVETPKLLQILDYLKSAFPHLRQISLYGSPGTILQKRPEELKALAENGVTMLYLGVETGAPDLLQAIQKGVTPGEMVAAGRKVITAGILLSCTIILGLAGIDTEKTKKNARETARLINQISPDYLAALTLMLEPGTRFYRQMQRGEFQLPDPYAIIAELKIILEHLQVQRPCVFRSNHASNYLPIKGTLPQDKPALIKVLNQVLQSKDDRYLRPDYMRGL